MTYPKHDTTKITFRQASKLFDDLRDPESTRVLLSVALRYWRDDKINDMRLDDVLSRVIARMNMGE